MSPPDAPTPPAPLGCPSYVSWQAVAALVPPTCVPLQNSLPPPRPFSEPSATRLDFDTWIAGSPATLVPQPGAPTAWDCSCPVENAVEPGVVAPPACLPAALPPCAPGAGAAG